jgi:histidinol-phosphate phosphatase family protein
MSSNTQGKLSSVAILAGGMGTRLKSRTGNLPKPMILLAGKPLLQHQIESCRRFGFTEIVLLVHHNFEVIRDYFGDGSAYGVHLTYSVESEPRGTAGALRDALPLLEERFLILYGDTYIDVNLRKIYAAHLEANAYATLFLHPNDHPQDSDLVEVDSEGRVISVLAYPHPQGREVRNLVNAALYVLEAKDLQSFIPVGQKSDLAKHIFPRLLADGRRLVAYISPEYIKDIGTPERVDKVERDIEFGIPDKLSDRELRSAVFLDRDGTINEEVNHLRTPDQLRTFPGVAESIRRLNRAGQLAVIVTNQPVLARGETTVNQLNQVHARLDCLLGIGGAYVDRTYYCPHHPDRGFEGEIVKLKMKCDCRKPATGLIDKACRDLGINRAASWMIGDMTVDVETGRRSGLKTILVTTGYAGRDEKYAVQPDYIVNSIEAAIDWILVGYGETKRRLARWIPLILDSKRCVVFNGCDPIQMAYTAQVLKESLRECGLTAHTICLDRFGLVVRRDFASRAKIDRSIFLSEVEEIANSPHRNILLEPIFPLETQNGSSYLRHTIGPKDILIITSVDQLPSQLLKSQATLKIESID